MTRRKRIKVENNIHIVFDNGKVSSKPFELSTGKVINNLSDALKLYDRLKEIVGCAYMTENHRNTGGYLVKTIKQYEMLQDAQAMKEQVIKVIGEFNV